MKLATYSHGGKQSYGVVVDGGIVDLGKKLGSKYPDLKSLIAGNGFADAKAAGTTADVKTADVTWLPTIPNPEKILCVGLNYKAHIEETGRKDEEQPVIFGRFASSQCGHLQPLVCPIESDRFDYEGELVAIIGKGGRRIPAKYALQHIAGYSIYNEGSVRDWQRHTHQYTPGKNFQNTGAFGPWMVTSDEIPDPYKLHITTRLNGNVMQDSGTNMMIFDIGAVIEYVSAFAELVPGDVIVTGTPGGVGNARKPPIYMQDGDTAEVEIKGIGTLVNKVVKEKK